MKYKITIVETVAYTKEIEASNRTDASQKAIEDYDKGGLWGDGERVDIYAQE